MLSAIAGSMLTGVTLTFSLILSATRKLRNSLRRAFSAILCATAPTMIGYFVPLFAYCLIVLRTIRGDDALKFVPSFVVMTGLLIRLQFITDPSIRFW